jgi:hypothetical protein
MPRGLFFDDPVFIKLCKEYEAAGRVLSKEIQDAARLLSKDQFQNLPGPRRRVDLFNLSEKRRTYELTAYRVFTYRPGVRQPDPPETSERKLKSLVRDASTTQWLGMDASTETYLNQAKDLLESECLKFFRDYQQKPDPKQQDAKRRLLEFLSHIQALIPERDTATLLENEYARLMSTGQLNEG